MSGMPGEKSQYVFNGMVWVNKKRVSFGIWETQCWFQLIED